MNFKEKIEKIDQLYTSNINNISGPADFKAILEMFSFSKDELTEHLLYPEDLPYGRKCIYRSGNFEVIVMNWKPRRESNIHDHGDSFGCVYSISGNAKNVLFNEKLENIGSVQLINQTIAEVPKGIFHKIENDSDDFSVSLHFYSPPMSGMKVIDSIDKNKNYIVGSNDGAWNPETKY